MDVKVRLARFPSLAEDLRTLSKSSRLIGRPMLTAACAHNSRWGIIVITEFLITSLNFSSPAAELVVSSLRGLLCG
jgi:hypothetical protein